ncbi:MAG: M48 family metalloprotease [Ignavibacteria bacterium]|jgi:predicted Zn-dependent protease|nr:M48 family metalloprotease [Ignavibacteria bacterium]
MLKRLLSNPRFLIAIVIAAVALISYYSKTEVNPITGEKQRVSLTQEQEVALGLQTAPQMIRQMGGEYNDPKVQAMVDRVGMKIVNGTEAGRSKYKFDFHVLADPNTVNAFALPGGQIFITMGLLNMLKTEDELAGVLGHEIGHVIGRHSAEHMAKEELTQGLVSAGTIATMDPNNPGMQNAIAQYIGSVINMKYGREDELEADRYGVKYLFETGYDPEAQIEVMEVLKKASGGQNPPEFLSTHPNPDNRIEAIKKYIRDYEKK